MSSYEISKSSLLSLKAEILRKQEELAKVKLENVEKIKLIKKKSLEFKNKGVEERHLNDLDNEEQDLLKLSRSKLEAKSKIYDQLSNNALPNEEVNRKYLVQFDKKSKTCEETFDTYVESDGEDGNLSDYDEHVDPSDEWVEYTDCLGRSRKCLRKDLEYFKSKDADLKHLAEKRQQTSSNNNEEKACQESEIETNSKSIEDDNEPTQVAEDKEMISGDMRREMLRKQWEEEEEELRNKTNIHYQNVLFNEARQHGVGYYAFSKDEEERARQQEALNQLRAETEQQQKKAQDLKALREKQLAARTKAARNRRRARLGLPPEEDEPEPTQESREKSEEDLKKKEIDEKKEEIEKILTEARKHHVRPWDIGKEGVNEFYQMTQEEWNEKKRQERPTEFAPPTFYNKREFNSMKTIECSMDDGDKSLKFSSKTNKIREGNKKLRNINPYKYSNTVNLEDSNSKHSSKTPKTVDTDNNSSDNADDDDDGDSLMKDYMESHAFNKHENRVYEPENPTSDVEDSSSINEDETRNVSGITPTPIVNELEVNDFEDELMSDYQRITQNIITEENDSLKRKGVEIAPPPTFEYYGHTGTKKIKNSAEPINISQSIEAGLKFLRNQAERKRHRPVDNFEIK